MSDGGCVTLLEGHAVRFSFIHKITGLKTYRGAKRKEQLGMLSMVVMHERVAAPSICAVPASHSPKARCMRRFTTVEL